MIVLQFYVSLLQKFLFVIFVTLLSGCSLFSENEDISKLSSFSLNNEHHITPKIVWSTSVGRGIGNSYSKLHPAYSDGLVYSADRKGTICAFNLSNGKKIWSTNLSLSKKSTWFSSHTSELLSGGITVYNGHLYIGSEKGKVYALNANSGSILWKVRVVGEVLSRPIFSDGLILVHTSNGKLQALYKDDGVMKWTVNLDIPPFPFFSIRGESIPIINSNMVIIGNDNGYITALSVQDGQIIWQKSISTIRTIDNIYLRDIDASPIIVDNIVYAVAYNGNLTAMNLQNGQIIWKCELGSLNDFIVKGNRLYLVDQNDRLIAVTTEDGSTLWENKGLLYRILTAPVFYKNSLVVGDRKGYIHWIDPKTGSCILQKKINTSGFLSKPIVADDKLIIQATDGKLYAING